MPDHTIYIEFLTQLTVPNAVHLTTLIPVLIKVEGNFEKTLQFFISPLFYGILYLMTCMGWVFFILALRGPKPKLLGRLTGLQGSKSEFLTGCFVLMNFLIYLTAYAYVWYTPKSTYKPRWADKLG